MASLPWSSIVTFCVFSIFISSQQRHHQTFNGASQGFHTFLGTSFAIGTITAIAYLIYLGVTVAWWSPLIVLILGYISMFASAFVLEPLVSNLGISMAGFIGWPVCAYIMFSTAS